MASTIPTTPTGIRILIVGAGIGGLACATALAKAGHTVKVIERDADESARPQGYYLGIRQSGVNALAKLGLLPQFMEAVEPSTTSLFHNIDMKGNQLITFERQSPKLTLDESAADDGAVIIARSRLRNLLLAGALSAGAEVKWDVNFNTAMETLDSASSSTTPAKALHQLFDTDMIVAADGTKSAVRECVIGDERKHLGCDRIGAKVTPEHAERIMAALKALLPAYETRTSTSVSWVAVCKGGCFFIGARTPVGGSVPTDVAWGFTFYPELFPDVAVSEYSAAAKSPEWQARLEASLSALRKRSGDEEWNSALAEMIRCTDVNTLHYSGMYTREMFCGWSKPFCFDDILLAGSTGRRAYDAGGCRRVTFIGDASHPMTPFAGQGANQALVDAISLTRELSAQVYLPIKGHDDGALAEQIHSALRAFEHEMIERSAPLVKQSVRNMQIFTMQSPVYSFARDWGLRALSAWKSRSAAPVPDAVAAEGTPRASHRHID